jgi:hypothetical protein
MGSRLENASDHSMGSGFSNFMWTDLYPLFSLLAVAGYLVSQIAAF